MDAELGFNTCHKRKQISYGSHNGVHVQIGVITITGILKFSLVTI
jgi:hypothetical protein